MTPKLGFKQLSEMQSAHSVLMGKEMQPAGILFLECCIHFSSNVAHGAVMDAPLGVPRRLQQRHLASPSCPLVSHSKGMWWRKYSYGWEQATRGSRSQAVSTLSLPGLWSAPWRPGGSLGAWFPSAFPCPGPGGIRMPRPCLGVDVPVCHDSGRDSPSSLHVLSAVYQPSTSILLGCKDVGC